MALTQQVGTQFGTGFAFARDSEGRVVPVTTLHPDTMAALAGPDSFENLPRTYTYNSDNNLETETVTGPNKTWVRTWTWNGPNLMAKSGWIEQ